jgi:hypothetical protein
MREFKESITGSDRDDDKDERDRDEFRLTAPEDESSLSAPKREREPAER